VGISVLKTVVWCIAEETEVVMGLPEYAPMAVQRAGADLSVDLKVEIMIYLL
jgi:hypothetical protein